MTEKPNPPRYPFVIIGPAGAITNDSGQIVGFRAKAAAEAAMNELTVSGLEGFRVERMPMSENLTIQGE